jgi:hypothetical protein
MSSGISADLVRKTLEALGFSFDQKLEDEVVCSLRNWRGGMRGPAAVKL